MNISSADFGCRRVSRLFCLDVLAASKLGPRLQNHCFPLLYEHPTSTNRKNNRNWVVSTSCHICWRAWFSAFHIMFSIFILCSHIILKNGDDLPPKIFSHLMSMLFRSFKKKMSLYGEKSTTFYQKQKKLPQDNIFTASKEKMAKELNLLLLHSLSLIYTRCMRVPVRLCCISSLSGAVR